LIAASTLIVFLLDWFYVLYMTSHGLHLGVESLQVAGSSISVQLQWLPVIGVVLVVFVGWMDVSAHVFPKRGLEVDTLGRVRLLRIFAVSLAMFVLVLYVPYLIGSNWFWASLSGLSKNIAQIGALGLALLSTDEWAMSLNPIWQYSLSQVLAALAWVSSAWAFGRVPRRPRKQR